jgi:hypothetical protein
MVLAEFFPIILIFLFLSQNEEFVRFSRTTLGKLVAIALIVYYTCIDKYLGLFACAVVVFFFQNDQIENMTDYEPMDDGAMTTQTVFLTTEETTPEPQFDPVADSNEILDDYVYLEAPTKSRSKQPTNKTTKQPTKILSPLEQFREDNCVKNQLMYKNMKVKNDMIEHVYPEIKFEGKVCNPCLSSCSVKVH